MNLKEKVIDPLDRKVKGNSNKSAYNTRDDAQDHEALRVAEAASEPLRQLMRYPAHPTASTLLDRLAAAFPAVDRIS